jgi:PadR family transcriptional regulator PadR
MPPRSPALDDTDLYAGLIRLHILRHAAEAPIFGLGMIEELSRHGYRLSAGTLYPVLHGLERRRSLRSSQRLVTGRARRVYRLTPAGARALATAKQRVWEPFGELFELLPTGVDPSRQTGRLSTRTR